MRLFIDIRKDDETIGTLEWLSNHKGHTAYPTWVYDAALSDARLAFSTRIQASSEEDTCDKQR